MEHDRECVLASEGMECVLASQGMCQWSITPLHAVNHLLVPAVCVHGYVCECRLRC